MRRLTRRIARTVQEHDIWPVAVLLAAVLLPAFCLLWFMDAAMRNERLAAREKLADAYRGHLRLAQERLEKYCVESGSKLEKLAEGAPASVAFARCIQSGIVESVILFDEQGHIIYPNAPHVQGTNLAELEPKWIEASQLEFLRKDLAGAAKAYHTLAREATNADLAARALQAEARCLVQAGQKEAGIRLVTDVLGNQRYDRALDRQGRLIAANAELMVLELTDPASPAFQSTAQRLEQRLADYENVSLAASQRRFLMKELQSLWQSQFPTLPAEELAANVHESRAPLTNLWRFTTPNQRVLALIRPARLLPALEASAANLPSDMEVTLLPPDIENHTALVTLPAGAQYPGWRLALFVKDPKRFATAANRRVTIYVWTGILMLTSVGVLTVLAIGLLRRQAALARLKNDLAATVSHELKTPLASMRVLVDTLLDSEKLSEQTVREYLGLIARENERLSRLIQNFLTFSRLERKKHTFHFSPVPARQIVDAAVESMRARLVAPGCRFELEAAPDLPHIMGDPDALTSALINLLDNACKYSEAGRHVVLSAHAQNGHVLFSVQDNGIGIPPREVKKVFQDFYQVDRRLSRNGGGCGLGLSIVQLIATAHNGGVSVASHPGRGSTFTISLPAHRVHERADC